VEGGVAGVELTIAGRTSGDTLCWLIPLTAVITFLSCAVVLLLEEAAEDCKEGLPIGDPGEEELEENNSLMRGTFGDGSHSKSSSSFPDPEEFFFIIRGEGLFGRAGGIATSGLLFCNFMKYFCA